MTNIKNKLFSVSAIKIIAIVIAFAILGASAQVTAAMAPDAEMVVALRAQMEETLVRLQKKRDDIALREERIAKIEAYFNQFNDPKIVMGDHAEGFVDAAEKYGFTEHVYLAAAQSMLESTGGKFACEPGNFNPFGWGSCELKFESYEEAIDTVVRNLSGNNPNTAQYYKNKNLDQIIESYNPASIAPKYRGNVYKVMAQIEVMDVSTKVATR